MGRLPPSAPARHVRARSALQPCDRPVAATSGAAAEPHRIDLRGYLQLRYGEFGSAELETPAVEPGTPEPSFGFGYRAELALLRYSNVGAERLWPAGRAALGVVFAL